MDCLKTIYNKNVKKSFDGTYSLVKQGVIMDCKCPGCKIARTISIRKTISENLGTDDWSFEPNKTPNWFME